MLGAGAVTFELSSVNDADRRTVRELQCIGSHAALNRWVLLARPQHRAVHPQRALRLGNSHLAGLSTGALRVSLAGRVGAMLASARKQSFSLAKLLLYPGGSGVCRILL